MDYCKLNVVTKRDVYLLPRVEETLEKMSNINYFSLLDLASGFWQVEIEEKDKEKTAFVCSADYLNLMLCHLALRMHLLRFNA